ncbi:sulfite exporter TauE/SafE family protein [Streptomyces microflavus]|uniref:sulfite exporter TauE/SafE family protein n=1 Tax=Streptomyces microflavus TaxID=1919 RepID=UPI0037B51D61
MDLTWWQVMIVAVVGVVGGGVNSLFGGGTLITFPALTILGIPAVNANITNTVATIPGYASGAWEQRTELRTQRRRVAVVAVPAVAGGLIGGLLLLHTSASAFEAVIPWLILITSVLLALQPQLKDHVARCLSAHHHRTSPPGASMRKLALVVAYAFLGSPYGGLFGAGLGVVMLTLFSFVLPDALTRINALKQNVSVLANASAAALFLTSDKIVWSAALALAVGPTLGGAVGGRFAAKVRPNVLRGVVVTIGLGVAAAFFAR